MYRLEKNIRASVLEDKTIGVLLNNTNVVSLKDVFNMEEKLSLNLISYVYEEDHLSILKDLNDREEKLRTLEKSYSLRHRNGCDLSVLNQRRPIIVAFNEYVNTLKNIESDSIEDNYFLVKDLLYSRGKWLFETYLYIRELLDPKEVGSVYNRKQLQNLVNDYKLMEDKDVCESLLKSVGMGNDLKLNQDHIIKKIIQHLSSLEVEVEKETDIYRKSKEEQFYVKRYIRTPEEQLFYNVCNSIGHNNFRLDKIIENRASMIIFTYSMIAYFGVLIYGIVDNYCLYLEKNL